MKFTEINSYLYSASMNGLERPYMAIKDERVLDILGVQKPHDKGSPCDIKRGLCSQFSATVKSLLTVHCKRRTLL